ncbi:MAG: hypothetical protein J5796_00735 [Erysipelotrichaceae bacterium]|nr:hypothetical protein [Erysipelotrichaceae bacterium]
MKKSFKKIMIVMMIVSVLTACSGGNTRKADNVQDARALADEFFASLADQDRYVATEKTKGEVYSIMTVDGDKVWITYPGMEEGSDVYLFVDNGLKYIMYEDDVPYQDDDLYDMFNSVSTIGMEMYIDALLSDETGEIKTNTTLTEKDDSKELVVKATMPSEDGDYTLTLTAKQEGGKLLNYVFNAEAGEETYNDEVTYEYGDDIRVDLPDYEIKVPRVYTHVESPYATIGDVMNKVGEDNFSSMVMDGVLYSVVDMLQVSAPMSDDVAAAYDELDIFDEDYQSKLKDLIRDLAIDDCVDFSEYVLKDEDFAGYIGGSVGSMVSDGFEENGWSVWEEGSVIWIEKDGMVYEADIELPEGFDAESEFDFSDLYDATVKSVRFSEMSYAEMPLQ